MWRGLRIIDHQPPLAVPQAARKRVEANCVMTVVVHSPREPGSRYLNNEKKQIKDEPKDDIQQHAFLHLPAPRKTRRALTVPAVACGSQGGCFLSAPAPDRRTPP